MTNSDLFLVNPDNQRFLSGQAATPIDSDRGGGTVWVIVVVFGAVGLFLIGFFFYQVYVNLALGFNAATIEGRVEGREQDEDDDGITYYVSYSYLVGAQRYHQRQAVGWEVYDRAETGATIVVNYARSNPALATVDGLDWGMMWFIAVFGLVWNGIVLALVYWRLDHGRVLRLLRAEGRVIDGQILQISGELDSDDDYSVTVLYQFVTPDTQALIDGKYNAFRNDLKDKLPRHATLVKVWYANPKAYQLL
jgi:hypothetical protein